MIVYSAKKLAFLVQILARIVHFLTSWWLSLFVGSFAL
jgi:hypothetical protein